MAAAKLGLNAKAYSTATRDGNWPPSSLTEITNLRDVTIPLEKGEANTSTRASAGFEITTGTLKKLSLEFEMVYDTTDAQQAALLAAFNTRSTIALAFLDQAYTVSGAQGIWADWEVVKFEKMEALEGAQMVKVTIKCGYSSSPPAWVQSGMAISHVYANGDGTWDVAFASTATRVAGTPNAAFKIAGVGVTVTAQNGATQIHVTSAAPLINEQPWTLSAQPNWVSQNVAFPQTASTEGS